MEQQKGQQGSEALQMSCDEGEGSGDMQQKRKRPSNVSDGMQEMFDNSGGLLPPAVSAPSKIAETASVPTTRAYRSASPPLLPSPPSAPAPSPGLQNGKYNPSQLTNIPGSISSDQVRSSPEEEIKQGKGTKNRGQCRKKVVQPKAFQKLATEGKSTRTSGKAVATQVPMRHESKSIMKKVVEKPGTSEKLWKPDEVKMLKKVCITSLHKHFGQWRYKEDVRPEFNKRVDSSRSRTDEGIRAKVNHLLQDHRDFREEHEQGKELYRDILSKATLDTVRKFGGLNMDEFAAAVEREFKSKTQEDGNRWKHVDPPCVSEVAVRENLKQRANDNHKAEISQGKKEFNLSEEKAMQVLKKSEEDLNKTGNELGLPQREKSQRFKRFRELFAEHAEEVPAEQRCSIWWRIGEDIEENLPVGLGAAKIYAKSKALGLQNVVMN